MTWHLFTDAKGDHILKIEDGVIWWVPEEPANTDYQAYLAWLAEGNTPEEWNPDAN